MKLLLNIGKSLSGAVGYADFWIKIITIQKL